MFCNKPMIYDFSKTFKTYDANSYKKEDFAAARCPKCPAIGRFSLHGSYYRHAAYFVEFELVHNHIEIKRVKCLSCKSTHAVMPGDLVPYRLLSLFAVIFALDAFYTQKKAALLIGAAWNFPHQSIYSIVGAFKMHIAAICQHFREASGGAIPPPGLDDAGVAALIKEPYAEFQHGYIKSNRRPCFMGKFFYRGNAPPAGLLGPGPPPFGRQHNA